MCWVPSKTSAVDLLWEKYKNVIIDVWMGCNYTSGITFIVENVSKMSMLILYSQRQFCESHWEIYPWSCCFFN